MASLYEINQSMLDCVDMETGEFDEERLHALQMERDAKIDNIIKWKISLDAYEKALAERENVFAARRKATHNLIERLKTIIADALDGRKLKTADYTVSYRKSASVEVTNALEIPDKYLIAQEPKVDKMLIKTALKNGEAVPGATLVEKSNIQIK